MPANSEPAAAPARPDLAIDYVEFPATDIPAAKRFYSSAFGWKFTDYGPDYTSFEDGRISGGFRKDERAVPGGPLIVLYARDLEKSLARVRELGAKVTKEIYSFPGGRRFEILDPVGNALAVWSE